MAGRCQHNLRVGPSNWRPAGRLSSGYHWVEMVRTTRICSATDELRPPARAFLIQVPITLLAMVSVIIGLRLPNVDNADFKAKLRRVDFAGAITLVVAVFSLLLGLDRGGNIAWTDRIAVACFVVFAVLSIAFVVIEWHMASEPFAPKHIVVNPALLACYLCNFFMIGANLAIIFHVSLYLQAVQGLNPGQVGLALLPGVIGGAIGSVSCGLIMRMSGKYYALTISSASLSSVGLLIIAGVTGPLLFTLIGLGAGTLVAQLNCVAKIHIHYQGWR